MKISHQQCNSLHIGIWHSFNLLEWSLKGLWKGKEKCVTNLYIYNRENMSKRIVVGTGFHLAIRWMISH